MPPMLKNLLGNNPKDRETAEEMRAVLHEMQQERGRYEALIQSARASADKLQQLGEPIVKASGEVEAMTARLQELERRFASMAASGTPPGGRAPTSCSASAASTRWSTPRAGWSWRTPAGRPTARAWTRRSR